MRAAIPPDCSLMTICNNPDPNVEARRKYEQRLEEARQAGKQLPIEATGGVKILKAP